MKFFITGRNLVNDDNAWIIRRTTWLNPAGSWSYQMFHEEPDSQNRPGTPVPRDNQDSGRPKPGCQPFSWNIRLSYLYGACCIIYSRNAPWIASFLDNTDKRDDLWWIGSQVFWITDDHPVWIFEIFKIHVPTYTYIISFQDSQKYLNRKRNRIFF